MKLRYLFSKLIQTPKTVQAETGLFSFYLSKNAYLLSSELFEYLNKNSYLRDEFPFLKEKEPIHANVMALHVHLLVDRLAQEPSLKREINILLYYCKNFYVDFAKAHVDYIPVDDFEDHFIENYHNRYNLIQESFSNPDLSLEEKVHKYVLLKEFS